MNEQAWPLFFEAAKALPLAKGEPMKAHTTLRVGGPARAFLEAQSREDLALALKAADQCGIPVLILGNGSNLLVADKGIDALVIHMGEGLSQLEVQGGRVIAGAGALLKAVSNAALAGSLSGFAYASGIPGSVGGAVYMNAGAYGDCIQNQVEWADVITRAGEYKRLTPDDLAFGYRTSRLQASGEIVLRVCFRFQPGDPEAINAAIQEYGRRRREKQPLSYPSCGSFFKRPEGHFAGALIEQSGLKGYTVGGAQVSQLHAGFLINLGGATAKDFIDLKNHVQKTVLARFGILLEPEVRILP